MSAAAALASYYPKTVFQYLKRTVMFVVKRDKMQDSKSVCKNACIVFEKTAKLWKDADALLATIDITYHFQDDLGVIMKACSALRAMSSPERLRCADSAWTKNPAADSDVCEVGNHGSNL